MADNAARLGPAAFRPEDQIDEIFSRGNPNPTRAGCPPRGVLVAAAGKKLPIGDPVYEHLGKCSPCYQDFRRIQQLQRPVRRSFPVRTAWLAAAAAVVLIAAGALWLLRSGEPTVAPASSPRPPTVAAVAQPLQIDLRNYSVSRTDQQAPTREEPLRLTRGSVKLTILLPVGSEPGHYDLRVLDSALRSRVSATGQAEIENFVTTLQATIDLGALPPGAYQLALRHEGDDWRLFPAVLE